LYNDIILTNKDQRGAKVPVNYQEIQQQVREFAKKGPSRLMELESRREQAQSLFTLHRENIDALRSRVFQTAEKNRSLRCACPVSGPLDQRVQLPFSVPGYTVLAADGSQAFPNRHDAIEFGIINTGIFCITPGQETTPQEITHSQLLMDDDLQRPQGPMTEDLLALLRDLRERSALAEVAESQVLPVVALTDGPLELFREPRDDADYQRYFADYLFALRKLAGTNAAVGGYVDRPRSDLVVRLLELAMVPETELNKALRNRELAQVTDTHLFAPLLQPGERSAIFAIQSPSSKNFENELSLHFFYLNVGREASHHLARIELPKWVVDQPGLVEMLQHALFNQSQLSGNRPYPYALHRAHEIALVSYQEKEQLKAIIQLEFIKHGIKPGTVSNKQYHKDHSGKRTRHKL
jgi:hypothetical protein